MDMGANLLACFGRTEHSDHRYRRGDLLLALVIVASLQLRVQFSWRSLIMIDAVQSNPKDIHPKSRVSVETSWGYTQRMVTSKQRKQIFIANVIERAHCVQSKQALGGRCVGGGTRPTIIGTVVADSRTGV